MNKVILYVVVLSFVLMAFVAGSYSGFFVADDSISEIKTFDDKGIEVCYQDGKPVIRMFSTTRCSHCMWVKDAYESVVKEYVDAGKIVAYHWELDVKDDTLTVGNEGFIPESEMEIYNSFSGGYVPAYSMGCKYTRVGNGHEKQKDLLAEEAEFRAIIEELLK